MPAYAWTWLQRSRPVLAEVARRLYGRDISAGEDTAALLVALQQDFVNDPFVRDVVHSVVCDIAFAGRIPARRPAGATWDRGLVWWAARLAGSSVSEFEDRSAIATGTQAALFPAPEVVTGARQPRRDEFIEPDQPSVPRRASSLERAALARALRELLDTSDGHEIPATAVRQLLASLDD